MLYTRTNRLQVLMDRYNVSFLSHGAKEDKLGDAFEDYCVSLLKDPTLLNKYNNNTLDSTNTDEYIFREILNQRPPMPTDQIHLLDADRDVEHRITGGNPKTDVILTVNRDLYIPISVKQTTADKVAVAEFDVGTIVREVGIQDAELIRLLTKHQVDASAKNFSTEEKETLRSKLNPIAEKFVRWVLTGSPNESSDLRFPKLMVRFRLNKEDEIEQIMISDIPNYVQSVMYAPNGSRRPGGFGTGLAWTYATGSKGQKIQFKA